ncbi:MAG: thermonuclease family protein [Alphaproteobacteria bacterium]
MVARPKDWRVYSGGAAQRRRAGARRLRPSTLILTGTLCALWALIAFGPWPPFQRQLTASVPPPAEALALAGTASVIDGDTIEVHGQRIRLFGIDAPEDGQTCRNAAGKAYRCGQVAALALADRIGRATVACEERDVDRYGRIVAVCRLGTLDLNAWLVAEGLAIDYPQYSNGMYAGEQAEAQAARRGLWAGEFVAPWEWRAAARAKPGERAKPVVTASVDCDIKGNVSKRGERIYHVPGGAYYDRTVISASKGERWFCSEREARDAGWRPSMR